MENVVVHVVAQAAKNSTMEARSTLEEIVLAYSSLVIMALLPIFFGSYRSLGYPTKKENETVTTKKALMFPIIASCGLFGLYIKLKLFTPQFTDLSVTEYFAALGILTLTNPVSSILSKLVPRMVMHKKDYVILMTQEDEENNLQSIIDWKFSSHDVVAFVCSLLVGVWYVQEQHWVANNLFALASALHAVERLHLDNVVAACILMSGMFLYDIFWVFGTDVMSTVARSFEAPIKLVFPQDFLRHGLSADKFALLGLGDVVLPGVFIALLLRFDYSLKRKSNFYFHATLLAYFLGLAVTMFVAQVFQHGQPALLYLVPACLGTALVLAFINGDLRALFKYQDNRDSIIEKKNRKKGAKTVEIKKEK